MQATVNRWVVGSNPTRAAKKVTECLDMNEKSTLDDAIKILSEKRTSINENDVDVILYQLVYQKELKLVYTNSVSNLVDKITQTKIKDFDLG